MRFLITGFAPFGGSRVNPSAEVLHHIPSRLGNNDILCEELPVEYDRSADILLSRIERYDPDCVLCIGQAAGREGISLEYAAANVKASNMPDNAGVTFSGEKILENGPETIPSNLPLKELSALLKEAGIPAKISYSAGTYVCNNLFYRLLYEIQTGRVHMLGGFLHIPPDEAQIADFAPGTPIMPVSEVVRSVKLIIAQLSSMQSAVPSLTRG